MSLRIALALAALAAAPGLAQTPDSTRALPAVEVTASPFALVPRRAPLALAVRERSEAERASDPAVSLDALGRGLPGVWISDRGSAATGERVLVRGLGWRAAFGVRGTHVLLDGVPLTLADGQSQLNVVDPALVRRVEVLRGPASTFWGSGSAGVLAFSTRGGTGTTVRALGGAYGLAKLEASATPDLGAGRRLSAWGSAMRQDGYRDHSAVRQARGGLSASAALGPGTLGVVALGAVVPRAEAPGGITSEAAAENPRQTRDLVLERDASKALAQGHLAATWTQRLSAPAGGPRLRVTGSLGARSLDNPIVPRVIALGRRTAGLRATVEGGRGVAWGVGAEAEGQRDDRLESENVGGTPGAVLTDQLETVTSGALFGRLAVPLGAAVTATAALRADALRYAAEPAGAPREARGLGALSPSLGLAWRLDGARGGATLYANAAGALDAPTTTELGNRPDGAAGFNPDLRPERTWGAEVGARGALALAGGVLGLDAAAFLARADDLLLPSEIDDQTVYANAGAARHLGLELGLSPSGVRLGPGALGGALALTLTRGTFLDGPAGSETPEGNRVPGFPPRLATWTLTWQAGALALGLDGEAAAAYAADSAGEQRTGAYAVAHLRIAAVLPLGRARATPFVSLRNVGDAQYAGSVVVNAFGGRFVEPAPGRHLAAGVSVRFD